MSVKRIKPLLMTLINPIKVEKYLKDLKYPAKKVDIIDNATRSEADRRVIEALKRLAKEVYESPIEVRRAVANVDQ